MKDLFHCSILVVAHPDDEALWFGSVLRKVDALAICYLDIPSEHDTSVGRRRCRTEYPLENTTWLGLGESEASYTVRWWKHQITGQGMKINGNRSRALQYAQNFHNLKRMLRERLSTFKNVFTHSPWGEYGHAEHVQVYRAVKSLQGELGFRIWCPNYCSQTTFNFMSTFINSCDRQYFNFKIDTKMVKNLRELYVRNNCWTWYEDWEWFREECFIEDHFFYCEKNESSANHLFPLNIIKMPELKGGNPIKNIARRFSMNRLL